jgi:hypothetical protein
MDNTDIQQKARQAELRRETLTDWVQALSGFDNGKATPQQARLRQQKQAEFEDKRHKESLNLQLLLLKEFAAVYERVTQNLTEAQTAVYETLMLVRGKIEEAERKASRTASGRIVFKDQDGQAYAADGQSLSDKEINSIRWNPDAASQEQYHALRGYESQLIGFDQRLMVIHDKTEDMKGDPSKENLAAMQGFDAEINRASDMAKKIQAELQSKPLGNAKFSSELGSDNIPAMPTL